MFKKLAVAFLSVMILSSLVACGNNDTSSGQRNGEPYQSRSSDGAFNDGRGAMSDIENGIDDGLNGIEEGIDDGINGIEKGIDNGIDAMDPSDNSRNSNNSGNSNGNMR